MKMDLKNNKLKALVLAGITGAIAACGTGCAATNDWAIQNQGNLALLNTGANWLNAAGSMMSGITGITGSVADWKQVDATRNQNKILNQRNNYRQPAYGPRRGHGR